MDKFGYVTPGADLTGIYGLLNTYAPAGSTPVLPQDMTTGGLPQLVATVTALMNGGLAQGLAQGNSGQVASAVDGDVELLSADAGKGNGGGNKVYRLREGIERFLITDINNAGSANMAQSTLPIMFDLVAIDQTAFNHIPGGSNVLYMDGHVEFSKYEKQGSGVCNSLVANTVGVIAVVL